VESAEASGPGALASAGLGTAFAIAVSYAFMILRWHYASDMLGRFLVAGVSTLLVLLLSEVSPPGIPHAQ
jgi:hypothetical protein